MILYRKTQPLRVRRSAVPEPPFWAATTIAPYGPRRSVPLAIDYTTLTAASAERVEVSVVASLEDELERLEARHPIREPVLIDGAEIAESVFGRAAAALGVCARAGKSSTLLLSTRSAFPAEVPDDAVIAIAAWPLDDTVLETIFEAAAGGGSRWGVLVPIVFPVTTGLAALSRLAELAKKHGAGFLASTPIDLDAPAKMALAESLGLGSEDDEYAMLFHAPLDRIQIATERHVAALAASIGADDFVPPPRWDARSNWNAAVLLTLSASRMLALEHEIDLAGDIARSARLVATLDKPLTRIAESAHLGIIEGLDDVSAEILGEWLEGDEPSFVDRVNRRWRLRRDHGIDA